MWSCQFRLYDDNEEPKDSPEVPHVFTDNMWFLGGIFYRVTNSELTAEGWSLDEADAQLGAIVDRLFWREQGGDWLELQLLESRRRSAHGPEGEVLAVLHHHYHVFAAGSLLPGTYEWRWETTEDPSRPVAYGEVDVVPD